MKTAVAWPHSRGCTKEPISAAPNYGSKETFGARAELRNIPQDKTGVEVLPGVDLIVNRRKTFILWAMQHRCDVHLPDVPAQQLY